MSMFSKGRDPRRKPRDLPQIAICTTTVWLCAANGLLAQSALPATPCLYAGRSFSDGARICVQKNLMMTCTLENTGPRWTLVLEKDLSSYCVTPTLNETGLGIATARPRHLRPPITNPVISRSAACFMFNGKRYCE
jgi:hypothetical protein